MPRSKSPAVEPVDEIWRCIQSHHTGVGQFYPEGTRLRRSRIGVFSGGLWVRDGADTSDVVEALSALEGDSLHLRPDPPQVGDGTVLKIITGLPPNSYPPTSYPPRYLEEGE